MNTSTLRRRAGTIALASLLLAAPAAQARPDEGGANPGTTAERTIRIDSADGFSWADAGIGAGAALTAIVVAGGAGHVLRRRSLPAHS